MKFLTIFSAAALVLSPAVIADWDLVSSTCATGFGDASPPWTNGLANHSKQSPCGGVNWQDENSGKQRMESGNPCNGPDTLEYTKEGSNYRIAVKARPGIRIGTCFPNRKILKACNRPGYSCTRFGEYWCQSGYCHT